MRLAYPLAALLLCASAALADPAPAPTPKVPLQPQVTEVQPAVPGETRGERRVCKTIRTTGSRLNVTRSCRTLAEWDALRQQSKAETDKRQRPNWNCSTCVGGS